MKKKFLLLIALILLCVSGFAQSLKNVDFFVQKDKLHITYDLQNCNTNIKRNIYIIVESSDGEIHYPQTMEGDFQNVTCGSNKLIIWDVFKDGVDLRGRYQVTLSLNRPGKTSLDNTKIVKIGEQFWMDQDLNVSTYRNGDPIKTNLRSDVWENTTDGALIRPTNSTSCFYNHYAIADPRGLCPAGWKIPTESDWNVLIKFIEPQADTSILGTQTTSRSGYLQELSLQPIAGLNTKPQRETGYSNTPIETKNNLPKFWWTASTVTYATAASRYFNENTGEVVSGISDRNNGFAVRCIKDRE